MHTLYFWGKVKHTLYFVLSIKSILFVGSGLLVPIYSCFLFQVEGGIIVSNATMVLEGHTMFHVPELLAVMCVAYGAVGWGCGGRLRNDNIPQVFADEALI